MMKVNDELIDVHVIFYLLDLSLKKIFRTSSFFIHSCVHLNFSQNFTSCSCEINHASHSSLRIPSLVICFKMTRRIKMPSSLILLHFLFLFPIFLFLLMQIFIIIYIFILADYWYESFVNVVSICGLNQTIINRLITTHPSSSLIKT